MTIKNVNISGQGELQINEFKLDSMVSSPAIVMIAKRGSGKSWVCKALLHHFKDIPAGLIIAPTDKNNCFYGNFFFDTYIHYEYRSDIIEKLLYRQTEIIEKQKKKLKRGKTVDTRVFVVMDDCLSSKGSWAKDRPVQQLLFDGRHYHIMYILTMQFPLGITPELRGNFDYIFLLADDFTSNIKRMHDHYAGMFPDLGSFRETFRELTDDFGCMVIVNRGARRSFFEKVFWYKAPNLDGISFKIGCKQFENFHKDNYDERWRERGRGQFDINEYCQRNKKDKKGLKIQKVPEEKQEKGEKRDKRDKPHQKEKYKGDF